LHDYQQTYNINLFSAKKKIEIGLNIAAVSTFTIPDWQNLENNYM